MAEPNLEQKTDQKTDQKTSSSGPGPDGSSEAWRNVSEVKDIISQRDSFKERVRSIDAENLDLKSRLQKLEDADKARNQKSEQEKLEAQGKYQEAVELTTKKYKDEFGSYQTKVVTKLIPNAIAAAAAEIENLAPEALKDLPNLVGSRIRLNPDTLEPEVLGDDGKPMVNAETLKTLSVKEFLTTYIKERPYLLLDRTVHGSGLKPGQKGPSGTGGWDIKEALKNPSYAKQWKEADPEGYQAAGKKYLNPEAMKELAKARIAKSSI